MTVLPVVILGSGPAAWSLAAASCLEGVDVTLLAPQPDFDWPQTFGMWTDQWSREVSRLAGLERPWRHSWDWVVAIGDTEHQVDRRYGVLDNARVRCGLRSVAEGTGRLTVREGTAINLEHEGEVCVIQLSKRRPVKARLVFDGTGASSSFVVRASHPNLPALQTAYGQVVSAQSVPFSENSCVLMDWRGPQRSDASFLYALSYGDGRWLFEETSLAKRGGMGQEELSRRLTVRLQELGVVVTEVHEREEVRFPMDVAVPSRNQHIVGIGAAASLVHPATGYSVAASFRSAPRLAKAIVSGVDGYANTTVANCWNALWTDERLKARRLETYGLDRLLTMDQVDTRAFFDTFFSLTTKQIGDYLGGEATTKELTAVMWNVFRRAPRHLQQRLATGNPLTLARSLLR